ncbi:MAG: response regulator transcription factor [Chthoniobacterales bacterium]
MKRGKTCLFIRRLRAGSPQSIALVVELVEEQASGAIARKRGDLTPREEEVYRWVGHGKSNDIIAHLLESKVGTIRKHVERIYPKLGVETRAEAVSLYAATHRED